MSTLRLLAWAALSSALACARGPTPPAVLEPRSEACARCRMAVSSARFAAQLVAPAEDPRFFDDLGCLTGYLAEHPASKATMAWVADHRTGHWVAAAGAVYARAAAVQTPMGSHLLAWADAASRAQDADAIGAVEVPIQELFGAGGPPFVARERP